MQFNDKRALRDVLGMGDGEHFSPEAIAEYERVRSMVDALGGGSLTHELIVTVALRIQDLGLKATAKPSVAKPPAAKKGGAFEEALAGTK